MVSDKNQGLKRENHLCWSEDQQRAEQRFLFFVPEGEQQNSLEPNVLPRVCIVAQLLKVLLQWKPCFADLERLGPTNLLCDEKRMRVTKRNKG